MDKYKVYRQLVKTQKLLWNNDDSMDQDDLFEAQEIMQNLVLEFAISVGKEEEVLKEFPYLYKIN